MKCHWISPFVISTYLLTTAARLSAADLGSMPMPPVSPTPASIEIVSRQNASTPGVAIMLWIVGSLSVAIGAIGTIVPLQNSGNSMGDAAFGVACSVL
jgi:hypothetical protein